MKLRCKIFGHWFNLLGVCIRCGYKLGGTGKE